MFVYTYNNYAVARSVEWTTCNIHSIVLLVVMQACSPTLISWATNMVLLALIDGPHAWSPRVISWTTNMVLLALIDGPHAWSPVLLAGPQTWFS